MRVRPAGRNHGDFQCNKASDAASSVDMDGRTVLRSLGATSLVAVAGCTDSSGSDTPTATPTPPDREFSYTVASPTQNVDPRDFELNNRTDPEWDVTVTISEKEADTTVLERRVILEGESEHPFDDIIGENGTYPIDIELTIGTSNQYGGPIE